MVTWLFDWSLALAKPLTLAMCIPNRETPTSTIKVVQRNMDSILRLDRPARLVFCRTEFRARSLDFLISTNVNVFAVRADVSASVSVNSARKASTLMIMG